MKQAIIFPLASALLTTFAATSMATHETANPAVLFMTDDEQVELARSAAPSRISKDATIMIVDKDHTPWSHITIYQDPMVMEK